MYYLFFFNDTATPEIYTLSLHDALPICRIPLGTCEAVILPPLDRSVRPLNDAAARRLHVADDEHEHRAVRHREALHEQRLDRKSTRLNSSHANISYAVFCLKKKRSRVRH